MSDAPVQLGVKTQVENCTFCPKMCRHACPVSTASGHETHIPQAKMDRLGQLVSGRTPWTEAMIEPLYACTGCRQCTTYCEHGNEPGLVLFAGRARAQAQGISHPLLAGYPERFRSREERLASALESHFGPESFATSGSTALFPGCDTIDKSMGAVHDTLDLLEHTTRGSVSLVAGRRVCGGYPLLAAGHLDMFRWHAARVCEELRGFQTVVLNCSACLYTMRVQYAAENLTVPAKVVSLAEFLAQGAERLSPVPPPKRKTVYYHDPCYMARYSGIIEEPRRVLSQVADVREFAWSKSDSECCGGAGLLPKTMPAVADEMARRRLRDISGRGGGTVVTSCGTCAFMLRSNAPEGVDVYDLPEFLSAQRPTP